MFSVNPDAANRDDVAKMAADIQALTAKCEGFRAGSGNL